MTDNEIEKALKYCEDCSANLNLDIINFITLKNAKLLELTDLINRLQVENEKLQNTLDDVLDREPILIARAEKYAVEEFWGKLKSHSRKMQSSDFSGEFWDRAVLVEDGDNLVKKMVGENNG